MKQFEDYELEDRCQQFSDCYGYPHTLNSGEWQEIHIRDIQDMLTVLDIREQKAVGTQINSTMVWQSYINFIDELNGIFEGIEQGCYWIDEVEGL